MRSLPENDLRGINMFDNIPDRTDDEEPGWEGEEKSWFLDEDRDYQYQEEFK
jgi:hypothetical protein